MESMVSAITDYWFNGHQLLERPVNDILRTGEPIFPLSVLGERKLDAPLGWPGSKYSGAEVRV